MRSPPIDFAKEISRKTLKFVIAYSCHIGQEYCRATPEGFPVSGGRFRLPRGKSWAHFVLYMGGGGFWDGGTQTVVYSVSVMVHIRLLALTTAPTLLSRLHGSLAARPPNHNETAHEILVHAAPAAPHWVIYSNKWTGSAAIKGYNVL